MQRPSVSRQDWPHREQQRQAQTCAYVAVRHPDLRTYAFAYIKEDRVPWEHFWTTFLPWALSEFPGCSTLGLLREQQTVRCMTFPGFPSLTVSTLPVRRSLLLYAAQSLCRQPLISSLATGTISKSPSPDSQPETSPCWTLTMRSRQTCQYQLACSSLFST